MEININDTNNAEINIIILLYSKNHYYINANLDNSCTLIVGENGRTALVIIN